MSSGTVHNVAQVGFGTGTNELYDKARPSYPSEALAALHAAIPKTDGKLNVLELGSGTGIFTRALLADPTFGPAVGKLEAVEPSAGMRATFEDKTKDERVVSREGTFSETGVPDGWADLVVVAQAFHWCPDYSAAMIEIARALKPNGVAAFIWNMEDQDAAGWVQDLRTFYEDFEKGTPQYRLRLWEATFSTGGYTSNFIAPQTEFFTRSIEGTEESVINRVLSKSYITMLSEEEKARVIQRIKDIVKEGKGKKWIDEDKGVFEYPYKTELVIMKKKN